MHLNKQTSILSPVMFLVYLIVGVAVVGLSPETVQLVNSDSQQYFTSAENFVAGNGLSVNLRGELHPTRYPPGLPVLFVAPWYILKTGTPAIAIYSITLMSLAVFLLCWHLCRSTLPGTIGIAAAFATQLSIMELVQFERLSQMIMSDIPILFLSLSALIIFLKCLQSPRLGWFVLGGLVVSVAVTMRVTNLALCLPFLIPLAKSFGTRMFRFSLAAFSIPVAVTLAVLLLYNHHTFGNPFYTGYHYWLTTVRINLSPVHFLQSTQEMLHPFNLPYQRETAIDWWIGPVLLALPLTTGILCRKFRPDTWMRTRPVLHFLLAYGLITILFFAFYPSANSRFILTIHVIWLCLGILWTLSFLKPNAIITGLGFITVASIATLGLHFEPGKRDKPYVNELIDRMDRVLPENAVIVGTLQEMVADRFLLRNTARSYIPLTNKKSMETWKIGKANMKRRKIGIASATTNPAQLKGFLNQGRPVFVFSHRFGLSDQNTALGALLAMYEHQVVFKIQGKDGMIELLQAK